MVASKSARERKAGVEAGPLGQVKIDIGADEQFVYKITCTTCTVKGGAKGSRSERAWSVYRPGEDNGYMAAMDRWIFHLKQKHPDADAPCLAYAEAAEQRLHERREQRDSASD